MDHQLPIDGPSMEKLFWIQTLPMDGPWVDHAWPCMGVHGISVRGSIKQKRPRFQKTARSDNQLISPNVKK